LADYTPNATSSDVCSAVTLQQNPPVGSSVFNTGTTVVTLTSRDASNNTTTCSFSVNRVDNTPPEITCPITQSVVLSSSCSVNLPARRAGSWRCPQIDVTVSSMGNAKSLRGGTLVMTPLKGADGQIYAQAQGNLLVPGAGASAPGARDCPFWWWMKKSIAACPRC